MSIKEINRKKITSPKYNAKEILLEKEKFIISLLGGYVRENASILK